jgi:tetratricopeptide (TPR) repeat protein
MSSQDIQNQVNELWAQAHQYQVVQRWRESIDCYSQIIQLAPNFVPAYVERGLLLQEFMRDLHRAKSDYETALRLDPQFGMAYYGRSWVKSSIGDFEGSLEDAKKGLLLDSKNAGMYFRRIATAYQGLKRYDEAIETYNEAIRLNSDRDEGTIYNRGLCYSTMKKYDLALADFNHCLELDPDWAWAFSARANVYLQLKEYDKAIEDSSSAIKYNQQYLQAYQIRGSSYKATGQNEKAKADFKSALALTSSMQERQKLQNVLKGLKRGWWDIF